MLATLFLTCLVTSRFVSSYHFSSISTNILLTKLPSTPGQPCVVCGHAWILHLIAEPHTLPEMLHRWLRGGTPDGVCAGFYHVSSFFTTRSSAVLSSPSLLFPGVLPPFVSVAGNGAIIYRFHFPRAFYSIYYTSFPNI